MKTPAEVYELSPRQFPEDPAEHSYPESFESRRVRGDGSMKWGGEQVFVGEAFRGERVGIEVVGDGLWHMHLGPLRLGVLHGRSRTIVPLETGVTHVPGHGDARHQRRGARGRVLQPPPRSFGKVLHRL